MVTRPLVTIFARLAAWLLTAPVLLLGCGGVTGDAWTSPNGSSGGRGHDEDRVVFDPSGTADSAFVAPPTDSAPDGFVVHEWGTNTIVVGSDGSLQPGLHHEEESLPGFVYDRLRAGQALGGDALLTFDDVACKLETPITYFYSPEPLVARVSVGFPEGVFTQWYPSVSSFAPPIAAPCNSVLEPGNPTVGDPVLDPAYPFVADMCRERLSPIREGVLDWGTIEILGRDEAAEAPEASLDEFTWAYARQVRANPLRAIVPSEQGVEEERFLFYRGLGNFDLPVRVEALGERGVSLWNVDGAATVGTVFVVNVDEERGAFVVDPTGIRPGETLVEVAPSLGDDGHPLDEYSRALGEEMVRALVNDGLYGDEARSMVATWQHQWFETPGLRVLYLLPREWTDRILPLDIEPEPDELVRVLVVRVEVLTPELEAVDTAAALELDDPATADAAEAHFTSLGRFAEPRLRRALDLLSQPTLGAHLLDDLGTRDVVATVGE